MSARKIVVYDTTLRDGAQGPDVSFSAADKERIARALDWLGFDYVEAGFPGSNPKDAELFARLGAKPLTHARLSAFGATRRAGGTCEDDTNLAALAASNAPVWTLVGKSDVWQVAKVLGTTTNENLAMVEESVAYGMGQGREVIFDAEHFFDGYARDAEYAVEVCLAAARAGASWVVLCDTNGGSLPSSVRDGVEAICRAMQSTGVVTRVGIHTHNDCELAVANTLAGVLAGADMVQGTINGYGERCGNANLVSVVSNLTLKLGMVALPEASLSRFSELSRTVAEIANHLKELEHQGYAYEAADASFEMLVRRLRPGYSAPWSVVDFTTQVRKNGGSVHAEATVKVEVAGAVYHTAASGNGPVNALDAALRKALSARFPALDDVSLHDYKVRILNGDAGTAATTRVLIESGRGATRWTTVGCSANIIEASLLALVDSLEYAVTIASQEKS